jgi:hypothetical protein
MQKFILLVPAALAGLFLSGCAEDGYDRGYAYNDRPGYYDDSGGGVDFVFEGDRPYSRSYGPLILRDGQYYYSRGGEYVVYDRPTRVSNTRYVNRNVNVRNVTYNNTRERGVSGTRSRGYNERNVTRNDAYAHEGGFHDNRGRSTYGNQSVRDGRQTQVSQTQVRTSDHRGQGPQVQVVDKKKKKNRD